MSPELISDILVKMVPAVVPREQEFYQKHKVVHIFDKDIEKSNYFQKFINLKLIVFNLYR